MVKYDVIVVGAGASGLLTALTLSKHGKKVLVLEKMHDVGGNCNSYTVDGYQVDTGPHAITHLVEGPLRRLMDNYFDYQPVFENYGHYYVRTEDRFLKVPSTIRDFVTFDVFPRLDRLAITQSITKALTLSSFGVDLSKQSVSESLPANLSKETYEFADAISYFLSGRSMSETSAQRVLAGSSFVRDSVTQEQFEEFIKEEKVPRPESILQSVLPSNLHTSLHSRINNVSSLGRLATNKVHMSQGYPRKGLKALLNAILYSLPSSVEIKTGCKVERILTKDGKAYGVEADTIYESDLVVYTGYTQVLHHLYHPLWMICLHHIWNFWMASFIAKASLYGWVLTGSWMSSITWARRSGSRTPHIWPCPSVIMMHLLLPRTNNLLVLLSSLMRTRM
jgi:phytoene dehydrogenase-like protein